MRRHKLNWIWIILLGLFVGSCEDYLDRSPDDGLSEDDVYLKSATPFPKCYLHKEKWTFDS